MSKFYRKREGSEEYPRIPQHRELQSCGNKVTVDIKNESGPGWSLVVTKNEVLITYVHAIGDFITYRLLIICINFTLCLLLISCD